MSLNTIPLKLNTFGLFLALGFILGSFWFWRLAKREGFPKDSAFDLVFLSTVTGLFGGRLMLIASFDARAIFTNPLSVFRVWEGVFLSASFVFGALAFFLYVRLRGWAFNKLADIASQALALSLIFGFLGAYEVPNAFTFIFAFASTSWIYAKKREAVGMVFLAFLPFLSLGIFLHEITRLEKSILFGLNLNYLLAGGVLLGSFLGVAFVILRRYPKVEDRIMHHIKEIFSKEFLRDLKDRLVSQERELEREEKRLTEGDPFSNRARNEARSVELMEGANEDVGHEVVEAELSFLKKLLVDTRSALAKMRVGKYGVCEICGEHIEKARLKAYPQAKYCLQCEEREDKKAEHVAR